MTINAWYNDTTKTYHIYYDGHQYTRRSFTAAKDLIESLLANLVLQTTVAA